MKHAIYNPQSKPIEELPFIIGFNNGGSKDWWHAQLIAQDGTPLGSHICSSEGFMYGDLGIYEGSRQDRHELFKAHYPDGYRMDFVRLVDVKHHALLQQAIRLYELNKPVSKGADVKITIEISD